jgi:hypothetical protein
MDLREALTQISEIRQQVARTELFQGYRALPVAFSGILALAAAGFQALCLPEPAQNMPAYLFLWLGAAIISMLATGMEMALHCRYANSALERAKVHWALGQFLPSIVAGGLVTFVLVEHVPESMWMLPGLWAIFFSLGIFASRRLLPRAISWVAIFYLAAGTICLVLAQGEWAFSPLAMGLPFGIGQLATAGILYWTLERTDGEK